MVKHRAFWRTCCGALLLYTTPILAQQTGAVRGVVYDKDAKVPLQATQVLLSETGITVTSTDDGKYVFRQIPPGKYTLIFTKAGYTQEVRDNVSVVAEQPTEIDVYLSGEVMEMQEVVVQDRQITGGTEAALLNLRRESPQLLDSISVETMSQAGASDAAEALNLVAGTSVQDGKSAVIRGLPDRYVNAQLNTVRLPTADADKRAVDLDQFPAEVIESLQVSKTFTPDQQGDASGGAVNVVLKGIPNETVFKLSLGTEWNTQVAGRDDFLTYQGGGVNAFGIGSGGRYIPADGMFDGAVGVSREDAPINYDVSLTAGSKYTFKHGIKVGGFASFFYERDSAFYQHGIDDELWIERPKKTRLVPQLIQNQGSGDFKTALFDVTRGSEEVKWGAVGALGLETDKHSLTLLYMYTRVAEDITTLAEDTRGKAFFFPGYDPDRRRTRGHNEPFSAPYLRNETLEYTERSTDTLQLSGRHTLPFPEVGVQKVFRLLPPEVDWTVSWNTATLYQPDKRQFGSLWTPERVIIPGVLSIPATHRPFKPAANFTLGNLQRIFKDIAEESEQYFVNVKLPFEQWSGDKGYLKLGVFHDQVKRTYDQDTFSNFNNNSVQFAGPFTEFFSEAFPTLPDAGPVTAGPPFVDVDYEGEQDILAWYFMVDLPLTSFFKVIGGMRLERTRISITNDPEQDATWLPPGASGPVTLNPGDADVSFRQYDQLPSIGFVFTPIAQVALRGSYTKTVARQTFKELSPIQQQEFLGGDVFIGNPDLQMSALENYDVRLDYTPYSGSLVSVSWFRKNVRRPIEFVQRNAGFTYTTPVNFPKGRLSGFEVEIRQHLGQFWQALDGLALQGNSTVIDSEVTLPPEEVALFASPALQVPRTTRDMVNAPEHLYNIGMTYDMKWSKTQLALFYTVRGDTLVAGAGQSSGRFIPDVYAREFGTLNLSVSQRIGKYLKVKFAAENLTNPKIEEVYRSGLGGRDVTKTSYRKGVDFSISVSTQ